MAGHFLPLRRAALRGAHDRTSPQRARRIRFLIGTALLALVCLMIALLDHRLGDAAAPALAGVIATLGAGFGGMNYHDLDPTPPRKLAMLGVGAGKSARVSFSHSVLGLPFLMLLLASIVFVVKEGLAAEDPLAWAWLAGGAIIGAGMVVTAARLGGILGTALDRLHGAGDWWRVLAILLGLGLAPALFLSLLAPEQQGGMPDLVSLVLAWSPFGAPWAAASAYAYGGTLPAAVRLGVGAATLVIMLVLYAWWARRQHAFALHSEWRKPGLALGIFDRFRATPAGAVAARSLVYWMRDPRYQVLLAGIIALPMIILIPLAFVGVDPRVLATIPVPVLSFLLAWMLHNDLAYDGSAIWLHVTSGMKGLSDRLGRATPALIVGGFVIVAGTLMTALLTQSWTAALSNAGIAAALVGGAAGISSITSALAPYAVARPGDSPFSQPVRSWGAAAPIALAGAVLCLIIATPSIACSVLGVMNNSWVFHICGFGIGLVLGVIVLIVGLRVGGRVFERRTSEIMSFASTL